MGATVKKNDPFYSELMRLVVPIAVQSFMLALSVCPLRGSQLPHRGIQGVRFRYPKQQFPF